MTGPRDYTTPRRAIALVAGPTPGHVFPAQAVAEAYRRAVADVDVLIIDTAGGLVGRLLPSGPWQRAEIAGAPLAGVGLAGKMRGMACVAPAIVQARTLLADRRVRLVLGLGAYVSGSVVLAARSLGIRAAIYEANVVAGLANRLLTPVVHRIYLAFPPRGRPPRGSSSLVTGHPIRAEIAALAREPRPAPEVGRATRVLVTGGGPGAPFLARRVPGLLARAATIGGRFEVLHQAGGEDPAAVRAAYACGGVPSAVVPHIADMAAAYRWADFAIARAGGGTLAELAVAGIPALLVPLAGAPRDHQTANARAAARAGWAWCAEEEAWSDESLALLVARVTGDRQTWTDASERARRFAPADAAERLVADCEAHMAGRW